MPDDTIDDPRQIIADLQRQLDERTAERDEALAQQTATAEVLQIINSSPGDLAPVFDAMLEKAMALCGAAFGGLTSYDGEKLSTVATRGLPPELVDIYRDPVIPRPGGPYARLLQGEPLVHIPDMAEEALLSAAPRPGALVEIGGARTRLELPLRKEDTLLGSMWFYRQEVRPFTDKQIALLQNFAAQAVIAMENARLITETREALAQQTATAEVLQVINASPGDLAPVFDAMLEKAMRLCGAAFGMMSTYDGEHFHTAVMRGVPEKYAVEHTRNPPHPGPETGLGRIERGEDIVQILDLADSEAYRSGDPRRRDVVDVGGARSYVAVALRKDGRLLGTIAAYRQEVRPFTDKQIALLQNFAAQAVIAMENARLITETREALEQQTATAEVLQVINSSPGDLAPVFDAILEKAHALCGAASGGLMLIDGNRYRAVAVHGDASFAKYWFDLGWIPFPTGDDTIFGRLSRGELVHYRDAAVDDGTPKSDQYHRLVELAGARSLVLVPLSKDGVLFGTITGFRQEAQPFSDKQIALLKDFAAQAVIAMENARLITETREALDQQTATAEVLQVINSSPGDLTPVFDAMLEKALTLCEAVCGQLATFDGETFEFVALKGDVRWLERRPHGRLPPSRGLTWPRIVGGEPYVHILDAWDTEAYRSGQEGARDTVITGGRTYLTVALRKEQALLGALTVYRQEVRPFSDKQIALLQNFAAQAVIAMENARLITETREALDQQTATAEVLQVINSSPGDLAPVFDAILEKAHTLCESTHGVLATFDGERFRAVATHGLPDQFVGLVSLPYPPYSGSLEERLVLGDEFVHIPDVAVMEALPDNPIARAAVDLTAVRTVLLLPLRKDGTLLGYISAHRKEVQPFTDKQIALLQNFAAQAVIAMENARLLGELRARTDEIAGWNRELEARVAAQLAEIERTGKLRRFLAPQLADLIVAQGDESILESHRREIVVVFCDLRGFTGFAERAEPEEVMALLRDYHAAMGPIVASFEGTLDHYAGDGIMVFFNDPLPTPEPAKRAIEMAVAMRAAAQALLKTWRRHGHDIGFGVGISQGYATLGQIGFAERMDYTAIGTVTNLAARLCGEARDGQILISRRVAIAVEDSAELEEIGDLSLKGLSQAVAVYNVMQ